ncbi:type IV pilus assembly protein PilN [Desulfacinum hydrothermale DSM 13146]|uniref:Type IV pilus assembly protein PilN n=1 Tax=Desulfacinum hydrothermale DSM 13146 TaxID=1121390 RepID=A0A1W1X216_9BACT|nr:PilN domain-containing protein [Desulfacinum hydrothermale]SMC17937.1 type IV pilus assembly protein PilN [Desulfacinum hydrothermale DSM 13146]
MIRINLLPVRKKEKKSTARQILLLYGLCVILTGIGIFYLWQTQAREIDRLSKRDAQLRAEVAKYAKYERLVKEIQKKKEVIERKKTVIRGLQKDRDQMARNLALMSLLVPPEKIWFQSLSLSGGRADINGIARSNEAIAEFMRNLRASPYVFKDSVQLSHSKQVTIAGRKLREFKLSCSIRAYSELRAALQEQKAKEKTGTTPSAPQGAKSVSQPQG